MSGSVCSIGGDSSGAILVAKAALARANGTVDADKQAHSPGCVAVDQPRADRASAELAAARRSQQAAANGGLSITV